MAEDGGESGTPPAVKRNKIIEPRKYKTPGKSLLSHKSNLSMAKLDRSVIDEIIGSQSLVSNNTQETMEVENSPPQNNNPIISKPKTEYLYQENDKGPFEVYIDTKIVGNSQRKPINAVSIGMLLNKWNIKGVLEVKKIGYGRCRIICNNYKVANNICQDIRFEENTFECKIMAHHLSKTGIIFNIDEDISAEELIQMIESPIPIIKAFRVTIRDKDDKEKRIPTKRIKIIFRGHEVPKEITLAHAKINCSIFIPFGQCFNCFRFNHHASQCKQTQSVCKKCATTHEGVGCDTIKCANCGGPHEATFKECPARLKAYEIKRQMAIHNLTMKEARDKISALVGNRFDILEDYDQNFPNINKTQKQTIDKHKESAGAIHKLFPYSTVTKGNPKPNQNRLNELANKQKSMLEWRQCIQAETLKTQSKVNIQNQYKVNEYEKLMNEFIKDITRHLCLWQNDTLPAETRNLLISFKTKSNLVNAKMDETEITQGPISSTI